MRSFNNSGPPRGEAAARTTLTSRKTSSRKNKDIMKKRLFMLTFAAMTGATGADAQEDAKKILTVYFSHGGNTKAVAEMINETAGGDILRIETRKPYPTNTARW